MHACSHAAGSLKCRPPRPVLGDITNIGAASPPLQPRTPDADMQQEPAGAGVYGFARCFMSLHAWYRIGSRMIWVLPTLCCRPSIYGGRHGDFACCIAASRPSSPARTASTTATRRQAAVWCEPMAAILQGTRDGGRYGLSSADLCQPVCGGAGGERLPCAAAAAGPQVRTQQRAGEPRARQYDTQQQRAPEG